MVFKSLSEKKLARGFLLSRNRSIRRIMLETLNHHFEGFKVSKLSNKGSGNFETFETLKRFVQESHDCSR